MITSLDKYQHLNSELDFTNTVNYLMTSDPQHPPLYYVMVRLWAGIFGDSPNGVRSLSALISLLIFPSIYWLCSELFKSPIVGWVTMALIAVSPLEVFFAQEARQYSLWMVAILVSTAVLLKAIDRQTKGDWTLYSLTLVLGLYTHLFTILVIMTHGIYLFVQQKLRLTKTVLIYLLSTTIAFLIFLPWLIVIISNLNTALELTSGWALKMIDNPFELIAIFLIRISRQFFDFNLTSDTFWIDSLVVEGPWYYSITSLIFSLALIIYLGYFLVKYSRHQKTLLIVILGGFSSLLLVMFDLTSGGIRSLQVRYQLPLCLSLEIIVAYVLSFHIFQEKIWQKKVWQFMTMGLLIVGLISDFRLLNSPSWWIQSQSQFIRKTEQFINQADKPLLIINNSYISLGDILTLSHSRSKVHLLPVADDDILPIPQDYSHIFFFQNNSTLFHRLKQDQNYSLKALEILKPSGGLWRFEKIVDLVQKKPILGGKTPET